MCSCSADKCLIANSFSCFKPRRESSCSVSSLTRVKSNCSNDDRPDTSMYSCCMNITHCVIAWLLEACSKPLQNYAELFFERCSKLPAFKEARRQMDQAVVRQWQALHLSEFAESLWVHGSDVLRSEVHLKLVRSASIYVRKMHYPYEIRCTNEYNLMWLIPIQTYSNNI